MSFVLLVGPRASGKTSLIFDLVPKDGYTFVYITFENLGQENVWSFIYNVLYAQLEELGITPGEPWNEASLFQRFLYEHTKGLNLVLFLDELDNVLYSEQRDNFLTTFRALRNSQDQHGLKAVVGLGVFSLIPMNTESAEVSPFNIKDGAVKASFLTRDETYQLLGEFMGHYRVVVSEAVVEALFVYTQGYPGLWNLCARIIQNEITRSNLKTFGVAEWRELVYSGTILTALRNYPSTSRIIDVFLRDRKLGSTAKSVFLQHLLSGNDEFTLDPTEKLTIFLANLGLIIPVDLELNTFTITSRILQDCVAVHILSHFSCPPSIIPPIDMDGKVNVLKTLVEAVKHLNYDSLKLALDFSFRTAEINGNQKVLKEAAYSYELGSLLRAWFPLDIHIVPEVNCNKGEADILIHSKTCSIVLELLSNERYSPETRRQSVLGHIKRAKEYSVALKGAEAWIVHFISVPELPAEHKFPDNPACSCAYVYHLPDFSCLDCLQEGESGINSCR
eukprot:TRINITY_DN330_c0_g1_i10.p1 TRINITY_DN330_c0_g1~~TRINITY_DN330_c0_g1_i10.p1  ORF type:complete len:505 (-),score=40.06 TRINITY_DN330_c0_g1_i10:58-1572(-)